MWKGRWTGGRKPPFMFKGKPGFGAPTSPGTLEACAGLGWEDQGHRSCRGGMEVPMYSDS